MVSEHTNQAIESLCKNLSFVAWMSILDDDVSREDIEQKIIASLAYWIHKFEKMTKEEFRAFMREDFERQAYGDKK